MENKTYFVLILTMLNLDIPFFENSVYPDQLASEKSAYQDPHSFPLSMKSIQLIGIL